MHRVDLLTTLSDTDRHMLQSLQHPVSVASPAEATTAGTRWSVLARLGFRFSASYFAFYILPMSLFRPVDLLAARWLAVPFDLMSPEMTGSGDKTIDWVHSLSVLVLAVITAGVWSLLDRKRRHYTGAMAWTRLALRYVLALILLGYGLAKVFPMQFQSPTTTRLAERFGDFSPMGVLWSFMGASVGYTRFAGSLEVLAAVLLLFRRTALPGALVATAVMANIFALNMFYDVPVKLYSFHLLLIAVAIAAPDLGRVFRFAVLRQLTPPPDPAGPVFATRRARLISWAGKVVVLGFVAWQVQMTHTQYEARARREALSGTYRVDGFSPWQQVAMANLASQPSMQVTHDHGATSTYAVEVDVAQSRLQLSERGTSIGSFAFRLAGEELTLEGSFRGSPARMHLVRQPDTFLLLQRGFHWVSEVPFNR